MTRSVGEKRPENRSAVVRTRFTNDEREAVKRAAERAGVTSAAFMREAALNAAKRQPARSAASTAGPKPKAAVYLERETVVQLRRVGTNLNQIARAVNAGQAQFTHVESRDLLLALDSLADDIARLTKSRRA